MDRPDSTLSRIFSGFVFAVALAMCAVGALRSSAPAWGAVLVFTVLFVLSDRIEIELPGGENINATFMIIAASVVVFGAEGAFIGPVLTRLVSELLYLPEWRARKWAKRAFNVGTSVLTAGAAMGCVLLLPNSFFGTVWGVFVIGAVTAAAAGVVNIGLIAVVDFLADGRPVKQVVAELAPYFSHELPFSIVGAFVGLLYVNVGPLVAPLVVAPILIAKQAFASYLQLKETQDAATDTLIRALESKDPYTGGHVGRVATYACYIGEQLSFTPGRMERLRLAALMHDIGKLIVPNELLNKPGRLTEDEFAIVKKHEAVSIELLQRIDFLAPVAPSAASEFTDYRPDDDRHPIEPYIVHVADAYDAMTSTRSYRRALSQGVAFAELRDKAGTQFHPVVVEALIAAVQARNEVHGRGHEEDQHLWAVPPPDAGTGSAGLGDLAPGGRGG